MKNRFGTAILVLSVIFMATNLNAQWLHYPTVGVPRTATGAPDLNAPTPRTADGKPDFSGIWEPFKNRPCPAAGCADMEIPQEFLNIGWGLKGGLPLQPWAAEAVRSRTEQNGKDDPVTHCLPASVLQLHTSPLLRKILQVPGLMVVLYEIGVDYRQIFTDARPLPIDPQPSFTGYSSGKWDGDTLIVETIGFKDGLWLDRNGTPLSDAAKITERFRRLNYGKLDIEITIDDPKVYTAPWTITIHHVLVVDTDLLDYVCLENEQDIPHLVGK